MTGKTSRKIRRKSSNDDGGTLTTNVTAITKAEGQIVSNALEAEDAFTNSYSNNILEPAINPEIYYSLVEENNTLNQCITAMEVNIDGTGQDLVRSDGEEMADADVTKTQAVRDLFKEVFPTQSLLTLRKELRREKEISGYAGIEVVRNPKQEIVFMRGLESKNFRLMKLDEAVPTVKRLTRGGVTASITLQKRERRFVQLINNKKVYFKEFGASRDLNKHTGKWAAPRSLKAKDRASEVIYITVQKSANSAYGVPRWLNNLPSVVGSRHAEELNLAYFEAGGIPPVMIFVSGGVMAEKARKQLNALLSGRASDKLRGLVADIEASSGTVDKASNVRVDVEKFGSEQQNDSMFENYDDKCEKRVRAAFRLPPLFVGKADDYSFASVFASYTLAEAQIFAPERREFDELINNTIMKELTDGEYEIKSKPLTVADAETNIKLLELAMNGEAVSKRSLVEAINKVGSMNLQVIPGSEAVLASRNSGPLSASRTNVPGQEANDVEEGPEVETGIDKIQKSELELYPEIADLYIKSIMGTINPSDQEYLGQALEGLTPNQKELVDLLVSNKLYASTSCDPVGMAELVGCLSCDKAEAGQVTGPAGVNDHTHQLLASGRTSIDEDHSHSWAEGDELTSEANGHRHTLLP